MNAFDTSVAQYVNQFVGLYPHFDAAVAFVSRNDLFKGGMLCPILWLLWAGNDRGVEERRVRIISLIWACFVALVLARILAVVLPFRVRPQHDPQLGLTLPHGMNPDALSSWSSLPSDHAALFMALSVGLWFVSRRWGIIAMAYSAVVILLPRLYLGLHYPNDLLVGAGVGALSAWLCNRPGVMRWLAQPMFAQYARHPGLVLAAMFLVTSQIAAMFEPTIDLAKTVGERANRWSKQGIPQVLKQGTPQVSKQSAPVPQEAVQGLPQAKL